MKILSDFSDVVAHGFTGFTEAVCVRFDVTRDTFGECLKRQLPQLWDLCRGKMRERVFWHGLASEARQAGIPATSGELMEAFYNNMQIPMPGTVDVYRRIVSYPAKMVPGSEIVAGRPEIAVVSDHILEMLPRLHEWYPEFFAMVQQEFWSCHYGAIKADPCFFETVLTELGGEPTDYLFIDDAPQNIAAAEAEGIPAIRYENAEQLEAAMRERGFSFASI